VRSYAISATWGEEDALRRLAPVSRCSRHEPTEYYILNLAGTDLVFTRCVPVAVKTKELAEKLAAETMRHKTLPVVLTETSKPMVRTEPVTPGRGPFPRGAGWRDRERGR
jgi:hypothetical protein